MLSKNKRRNYVLGQSETWASILHADGIWRARVVLTGRPMEGSVLSLMRTHKHLGLLAFTFWVSWQHSGVGFLAAPLTKGMQAARFPSWSAHSFSSSCNVAVDIIASEATTTQKTVNILTLAIFLVFFCSFFCQSSCSLLLGFTSLCFPSLFCCFFLA